MRRGLFDGPEIQLISATLTVKSVTVTTYDWFDDDWFD